MPSNATLEPWLRPFLICVTLILVVVALYYAQEVLIPLAAACLLTLILSPLVVAFQHWGLGRVPSVVLAMLLALTVLGGIGFVVFVQVKTLATDLPQHEAELSEKLHSIRQMSKNSWMDGIYRTVNRVVSSDQTDSGIDGTEKPLPVREESSSFPIIKWVASPALQLLVSTILVLVFAGFMLIQREDLRNRFIRLLGNGSLTSMTKAADEAVRRISRFLLMQFILNSIFGVAVGGALWVIGVPYAALWGFLAGLLRYIPYIGTPIACALPALLTLAMVPGWTRPLLVLAVYLALEIVAYYVAEPLLYGRSVGVSTVALLVSAAFWGWLWGPIGLVLSTPLTACLAVLGKYMPQFEFLNILLGDEPVLEPHVSLYQRLLARDSDEAVELVEEFVQTHSPAELYDRVLVPALVLAKKSRGRGEYTADDEQYILQAYKDMLDELPTPSDHAEDGEPYDPSTPKVLILACPAHDEVDRIALLMFQHLLDGSRCRFEVLSVQKLAAEVVDQIERDEPAALFVASLPPGGLSHARYVCKRVRSRFPDLKILAGFWGLEGDADVLRRRLLEAGADHVGVTLLESRGQLLPFAQLHPHIERTTASTLQAIENAAAS
jgi:predicted PurR-regulated permease PerM